MAKKGGSTREIMAWSFTMLTLAISCAALSILIQENSDLRQEVAELTVSVNQ